MKSNGNSSKQANSTNLNEPLSRPHRWSSFLFWRLSDVEKFFFCGVVLIRFLMISSSNSSQSIWPVATMKLLSPASKACPREPTEEVTMMMIVETLMMVMMMMVVMLPRRLAQGTHQRGDNVDDSGDNEHFLHS